MTIACSKSERAIAGWNEGLAMVRKYFLTIA
jgi:hypothetical protein